MPAKSANFLEKNMSSELEQSDIALFSFGPEGLELLPVVTQDINTKEVLIVSYINLQALTETRQSGYACYWSRSRNSLWKKGESSGNRLKIIEIRINCEQNSFLFLVEQEGGGACHALRQNGQAHTSCYYRRLLADDYLEFVEI
jgi:phosphoribosyl-AMP cyclohydrolase